MFLEDTGIVLRAQPYQERDLLVTLLTENNGKLSGVAKGAIHSKRFGGAFDLFTCIQFRAKDSHQLVRIEVAEIRRDFLAIRERLENVSAAGYFTDLCLRLSEERHPTREIFLLLAHYLFLIERETATLEIVRSFEIKLLDRLGYSPDLNCCVNCENEFTTDQNLWSAVERGGFLCENCKKGHEKPMTGPTLQWLRTAREANIQNTHQLSFPAPVTQSGASILMQFLRFHCPGLGNYEFRSHKLLEQFLEKAKKNHPGH